MERARFRGWEVSADVDATQRAYLQIEQGEAETCRCPACRNFVLMRDKFYPAEVRGLLTCLGIDYRREAELLYWAPHGDEGGRYYGAFHFVGDVEVMILRYGCGKLLCQIVVRGDQATRRASARWRWRRRSPARVA